MAVEPKSKPGIRNTYLIIIAVSLGVMAVIAYLIHLNMIRTAQEKEMVSVLVFTRNIQEGELIKRKDVAVKSMNRSYAAGLGKPLIQEDFPTVYAEKEIAQMSAARGDIVQYHHISTSEGSRPSARIPAKPERMVAVGLKLDPREVPGDVLRPDDRVNIVAVLSVGGKTPRTYRVIREVRIIAVGGRGASSRKLRSGQRVVSGYAPTAYRNVTIAVPENVSLELLNVLSHAIGYPQVELCSSHRDAEKHEDRGRIDKALTPLTQRAAVAPRDASQLKTQLTPPR